MSSFPPPGDGPPPPPGDSVPQADDPAWTYASTHPAVAPGRPGGSGDERPASGVSRPTVPLRPLELGDMFDGAFRTIRQNPKATIGFAFLVNLVFLVIPVLGLAVLAALGQLGPLVPDLDAANQDPFAAGPFAGGALSGISGALAGVIVTGLVVQVVARAAIGEKLSAGEAWRRTRPRIVRLLGLSLLSGLLPLTVFGLVAGFATLVGLAAGTAAGIGVGVLLGIGAVVFTVWFWTRYLLLAPAVLVLEGTGIIASARRARTLSTGSFWRLLGIYLLVALAAYMAASLISLPLGLGAVGTLFLSGDTTTGTVLYLMINNLSTVITGALSTPFVGAVVALQYIDVRIRREGLDVRLRQQAARRASGNGTPGTTGG